MSTPDKEAARAADDAALAAVEALAQDRNWSHLAIRCLEAVSRHAGCYNGFWFCYAFLAPCFKGKSGCQGHRCALCNAEEIAKEATDAE